MTATPVDSQPAAPGTSAAGWLPPDTLAEDLQLIADGVVAVAGFGVAAIRIRRGDDLVLVAASGLRDGVGTRLPVQAMLDELDLAENWGPLCFVAQERNAFDADSGWVIPDVGVSEGPDAWHPVDLLVAPLYDAEGELRGTLAIDDPVDGRRPGAERRQVLEGFAALASRAVLSAVERESLAEQVAMATTVKTVVRTTSAQLSLDGLVRASERTLLEGFGAQHLWIKTVADDGAAGAEHLPDGVRQVLPPEIVAFAEESRRYCWREQLVMTVGRAYPVPEGFAQHHFDHIVDLLESMSMASLVFVPLGAGPECMGSLVLVRSDPRREWTSIECAALLDIGHDLGRAALNARTFEREHSLVAELQALDSYRSQLIDTVSHELKSPLTTITGHLELLETGETNRTEDDRGSLEAIGRASRRMTRVIEDLLLLREVGEPERPVRQDDVDLLDIVVDVLGLTSISAQRKRLDITVTQPTEPVLARGDRDDLDKVVLNLVSNAVKYTPEGRRVQIALDSCHDVVVLSVRDEGIGISPQDQRHLFTEFFRSTNPQAVAQPGTGLGLAIVKRIVERHNGEIGVESQIGSGSTFTVRLPAARPQDPSRGLVGVPGG